MKKLNKLKLSDNAEILNHNQMKMIVGGEGYEINESCTYSLTCANGSVSCTSATGKCENIWKNGLRVGIKCDGKEHTCL